MSDNVLNSTSQTDWDALDRMTDDEIDYSDIPPLTEEFFKNASLRIPASQMAQWVKVDPDIVEWFQAHSSQHKAQINTILREYITQHP